MGPWPSRSVNDNIRSELVPTRTIKSGSKAVVVERQNCAPVELVRLALKAGHGEFESYDTFALAFQKALGCEPDYARRLLGGTRQLREVHRKTICELLGLGEIDFNLAPREFAVQLGLSRRDATSLLVKGRGGIDFASRVADRRSVQQLFELIQGYWETYQWSVSKLTQQAISRELCVVDEIDDDNFIQCRLIDVNFTYSGVIFPMLQHLYFFMEKDRLFDEVAVNITNRPDRTPPVLRGIALCLSGGVDEMHSYPSAGKISFRYLGRNSGDVRQRHPDAPAVQDELEGHLTKTVPRYILRSEIDNLPAEDPIHSQVRRIGNAIHPDAIPFAMRTTD
jgi:hypothetical protein